MIAFKPSQESDHGYTGLYQPFTSNTPTSARLLDVLTYPCSALISGLVVVGVALALRRRFGWAVALVPAAAWVLGNVVEEIGKHLLIRPALYTSEDGEHLHVVGYDSSFPSGHTIRCVVVAAGIVLVWRRAMPVVLAWVALVGPALVVEDAHTPTDVIGGALVGAMLLLLMLGPVGPVLSGSGTGRKDRSYPDPSARTETAPGIRT
jgi:membrane-associated phospholipid phosphatase